MNQSMHACNATNHPAGTRSSEARWRSIAWRLRTRRWTRRRGGSDPGTRRVTWTPSRKQPARRRKSTTASTASYGARTSRRSCASRSATSPSAVSQQGQQWAEIQYFRSRLLQVVASLSIHQSIHHSFVRSFIHLYIISCVSPLDHWSLDSLINPSFILIHSFIHFCIYLPSRHSMIGPLLHSLIHSFLWIMD